MNNESPLLYPKDPAEIITVTFGFEKLADTITAAVVTASVLSGLPDNNPSAIVSGPPSMTAALVRQRIAAGQPGTVYALRCEANDADGELHVLTAALPVCTSTPI